jgi:hypothetical protein
MMLFSMISAPAAFFTSKKKQRLRYLARKRPFVAPELFEGRTIQVDEPLKAVGQPRASGVEPTGARDCCGRGGRHDPSTGSGHERAAPGDARCYKARFRNSRR